VEHNISSAVENTEYLCQYTKSGVAGLSEISAQDYKKAIEALKLAKGAEGKGAKAA